MAAADEPVEMRIIAVEHGDAAGLEPEKYFGLRIGDRLERRENPRWAGSTVVMIATCGRTSLVRTVISPGWFMPSSKIP